MENNNVNLLLQELKEQVSILSERQNTQYTDLMLLLRKIEEKLVEETIEEQYPEDELFEDAKNLVIEMQKVSTSFLQRALGIGYSRAAALMDKLEADGIIGKSKDLVSKEVIIKSPNK